MSDFNFKVNDWVKETSNCLPADRYVVKIISAMIEPTKSNLAGENNNQNLVIEFQIQDHEKYENEVIKQWLCINHVNEQAQRISREKLAQLAKTLGIENLELCSQLEDHTLMIETEVSRSAEFGDSARVKKYLGAVIPNNDSEKEEEFIDDEVPF